MLEVGEEQDKDLLGVAGYFDQVDYVVDLVEVSVEDLSTQLDPILIEADVHGWRSLLRHDVDLIRPSSTTQLIIHALLEAVRAGAQVVYLVGVASVETFLCVGCAEARHISFVTLGLVSCVPLIALSVQLGKHGLTLLLVGLLATHWACHGGVKIGSAIGSLCR